MNLCKKAFTDNTETILSRRFLTGILFTLTTFFLAACVVPAVSYAGPAREVAATYTQPDSATFEATTYGDESFSYV